MLFEVETPLGFTARCSQAYWEIITTIKHPVMAGRVEDVKQTLVDPDEIRRSQKDADVLLFYRADGVRWLCAVVRRLDGDGFLITTYPTDAIKSGEQVWSK
jgi:hypothetical protein